MHTVYSIQYTLKHTVYGIYIVKPGKTSWSCCVRRKVSTEFLIIQLCKSVQLKLYSSNSFLVHSKSFTRGPYYPGHYPICSALCIFQKSEHRAIFQTLCTMYCTLSTSTYNAFHDAVESRLIACQVSLYVPIVYTCVVQTSAVQCSIVQCSVVLCS